MSSAQRTPITLDRLMGRDGSTGAELSIPMHRAKECLNTDFYQAPFGRKRNGAESISVTGANFTGTVSALLRAQFTAASTAAVLIGIDDAATPVVAKLESGSWAGVTMKDNIATKPWEVRLAMLNGIGYFTSDTTQDRLHALLSDGTTRRVGLATPAQPAAPTDTGSGSYAATLRYYRIAYTVKSGSHVLYRSELSPSRSFTPNGTSTHARIAKPASISESETHWEIYASADDAVYYGPINSGGTVVGTTTYDDNTTVSNYALLDLAPLDGQNTVPTSWKYITSDGNRLIGAGAWESGGKVARVWFSPVIGTTASTFYDQERIPDVFGTQQNWLDLDESDGGAITGLIGPYYGSIYVFKDRQIWKLVPTGDAIVPYRPFQIGKGSGIGALNQEGIVMAEDERGNSAVYFWSHRGPYRLTIDGLQYVGKDIEDLTATVNMEATTVAVHAQYHTAKHQIWWWLATGASNDPDTKVVLDVQLLREEDGLFRNGWSKHTSTSASARCSVMFSTSYASTTGRAQVPYIGQTGGTARIWRTDTGTTDQGTAFQAYQQLPARHYGGISRRAAVGSTVMVGSAGSQTLTVTYAPNYGAYTSVSGSVSMAAGGSETRVTRQVEISYEGVEALAVTVGDGLALDSSWVLDAVTFPIELRDELAVA